MTQSLVLSDEEVNKLEAHLERTVHLTPVEEREIRLIATIRSLQQPQEELNAEVARLNLEVLLKDREIRRLRVEVRKLHGSVNGLSATAVAVAKDNRHLRNMVLIAQGHLKIGWPEAVSDYLTEALRGSGVDV